MRRIRKYVVYKGISTCTVISATGRLGRKLELEVKS
jgi:hypothetical protein